MWPHIYGEPWDPRRSGSVFSFGRLRMKRTWIFTVLSCLFTAGLCAAAPSVPSGKIALTSCKPPGLPETARCGTYEVFENRADRTGRKIPLRVVVIPADAPQKQPDAITYFAGGPGGAASEEGGWFVRTLRARGPLTRDVLLVDLRGTGQSAPLKCAELAGAQGVQGFLDNFLPVEGIRTCHERLRRTTDLTQYTTDNSVDDVDEVRAALGYEKLNLIGASYGTRTELIYMRRHPERVRTAILIGVVPNDDRSPLYFARGAQAALDGLIAECASDAACHAAFPRVREEVAEILRRTEKEPARAELIDPETGKTYEVRFNRNGVAQTLRYMLYDTATAAQLPLFVHLAAEGDFRPLAQVARGWSIGGWSSVGYFLAITCAEDVAFIRDDEVQSAVAGSFLGDFRVRQQQAACKAWTPAKLGPDFLAPTISDAPALVISGERDPATPASDGEKVAKHLRHGVHVIIPDGAHSDNGMKELDCQTDMMTKLLETGTAEGLDTSCVARMERPAFALSLGDPEVILAAADLQRVTGTYHSDRLGEDVILDVLGKNRLRVRFQSGDPLLFVPTSPTRFRAEGLGPGVILTLSLTDGGRATAAVLEEPGSPNLELTRVR